MRNTMSHCRVYRVTDHTFVGATIDEARKNDVHINKCLRYFNKCQFRQSLNTRSVQLSYFANKLVINGKLRNNVCQPITIRYNVLDNFHPLGLTDHLMCARGRNLCKTMYLIAIDNHMLLRSFPLITSLLAK